ncbi:hypothetical protein OIU81_02840 [Streptomyces sp. NBC_01454]|uniref:hypothetical protein n=1 Tax=Streptomyces sp. NBC_01454 TaxID=2975867 RepID=UPI002E2F080D|nr:hypothetical protein [Streptomyces sp. NBC_01454]
MPQPDVAYAWAPITKMQEEDDGTLLVYGPAASSDLDRDQQRLNSAWLDQAMPRWFSEGANVREQHDGRKAVGVGVGLTKGDDEGGTHMLAARIVDPVAVAKCRHGVLKGFSVGIKSPRVTMGKTDAPGGEIVGGDIIEVSVVDRPCNPTTLFEIAKADGAGGHLEAVDGAEVTEKSEAEAFGLPQELYDRLAAPVKDALAELAAGGATVSAETVKSDDAAPQLVVNVAVTATESAKADTSASGRREAAADGAALPDGSYPIKTKADLRKAIKAVGRGGSDHDKIRAHVIKRAKALGLEAMVPSNWNSNGSLKASAKADDEVVAKAEQLLRDVRALAPSLSKADGEEAEAGGASGADGEEAEDISGADEAIACIARLIIAEAESLAQGNLNEACDIDLLLSAVRSLTWFKQNEQYEEAAASKSDDADGAGSPEAPGPEAVAGSLLTAEQVAAVHAAGLPPGTPITKEVVAEAMAAQTSASGSPTAESTTKEGERADGEQPTEAVTKADLAELVKAAVAQAAEASEERNKALEVELAKAQQAIEEFRAMPTAGGPALTRTAAQQAQAKGSDADRMRQEAKTLMAKADQVADRDLRDGYRDRAKALLAKADA